MIYTFNAKGCILYPVMKSYFELSDDDVYKTIQDGFKLLLDQLAIKKISYDSLKRALVPNQDKDRFETCFVIDSAQIDRCDYGYYVFEKLIPLLDKESTYSILCGDYIDLSSKYQSNSQLQLRYEMNKVLSRCHESEYRHSSQYFLIYINRLSGSQRLKIVETLYLYQWFTGFADVTHQSVFKSYISNILTNVCIKNKNTVIMSHPADYSDKDNINMRGFPFNALFPKFDSFEQIKLQISDDKWNNYLIDKEKGKGRIMEALGYDSVDKECFRKEVFKHICANYIYDLKKNEQGVLMFNVCVELPTINDHIRKTKIVLKYHPDTGIIEIVTVT